MGLFKKIMKTLLTHSTDRFAECTQAIMIKNMYFDVLAELFERGDPTYKSIGKYIYNGNERRMEREIFVPLDLKVKKKCGYDDTYIKFYAGTSQFYIIIPFSVFAEKIPVEFFDVKYGKKAWHKESVKNIKRFRER